MGKDEKFEKRRISLDVLDQNKSVDQEDYRVKLKEYQLRLLNPQRVLMESRHSVVVVVEGPDAAGKGGAIKRLVEKLDPRTFRVYSIVKPTQEEYAHHYLWRFWSKLPPYGQIAIFDRSWYGRVLVERVEGASGAEWRRAYREINEFERLLVEDGTQSSKSIFRSPRMNNWIDSSVAKPTRSNIGRLRKRTGAIGENGMSSTRPRKRCLNKLERRLPVGRWWRRISNGTHA
jgi:polyphosphate kinase 2 (PPK2 family)